MCNISYLSKLTAVFVCTMSDTDKSKGKEAMPDAEEKKIWQILPHQGGFGYGTLLEVTLPSSCKTEKDLLKYLQKSETVSIFGFTEKLQILAVANCPGAAAHEEFNFYAAKISGEAISGPFTIVCIYNEQIVNMDEFLKLCTENGMRFREFKRKEKQFDGSVGDMLHRLVKAMAKFKARQKEERQASPDIDSGAAASGSGAAASSSGAAASGSGAATSGSEAAEVDVRRSGRVRKPKQIFDPSIVKRVKREPQGD